MAGIVSVSLAACSSESDERGGSGSRAASSGSGGSVASCEPSFSAETTHLAAGATLAPGTEVSKCLRWTTSEPLDVTAFAGTLGQSGHHALLLAQPSGADPDGLTSCSEAEIMDAETHGSFQVLAGVSYDSDGERFVFPSAPVQVGLHVSAGTQLVFEAHFLNSGSQEAKGCASIDLDRGKKVVAALQFRTVLPAEEYTLTVPPHGSREATFVQAAGGKFRIGAASSHMHAGGTHFRMTIKETGQLLYETSNWAEPKPATFLGEKVVVDADQTFQLECSFENASAEEIRFPQQMCAGVMYLLPCVLPGAC